MTDKTPGLDAAYGLDGPEDNLRLYANWAETYDRDFAEGMGYLLPAHVARAFVQEGGRGPVLDFGAGTGLVGQALHRLGVAPVDGTDLSADMLHQAEAKGVYRSVFAGDMLAGLPVPDGAYAGAVCAGTFTLGHVGPEGLEEVLRCVAPGGLAMVSVNAAHYRDAGFSGALDRLGDTVRITRETVRIYSEAAEGAHRDDTALLVGLHKV